MCASSTGKAGGAMVAAVVWCTRSTCSEGGTLEGTNKLTASWRRLSVDIAGSANARLNRFPFGERRDEYGQNIAPSPRMNAPLRWWYVSLEQLPPSAQAAAGERSSSPGFHASRTADSPAAENPLPLQARRRKGKGSERRKGSRGRPAVSQHMHEWVVRQQPKNVSWFPTPCWKS